MNPDNNGQVPPNNLAHLQRPMIPDQMPQNVQNVSLTRKINEVESHICGEVVLLAFFGILLGVQYNHACIQANLRQIVIFVCYLAGFKIPINALKSFTLRKYQKESIAGLGCGVISKIFLTGWMIYSYINFFNIEERETCQNYWPMYLFLAYGFYVFLQA